MSDKNSFTFEFTYHKELNKKLNKYDEKLCAYREKLNLDLDIEKYCILYPIQSHLGNYLYFTFQRYKQELTVETNILDINYNKISEDLFDTRIFESEELFSKELELGKLLIKEIKELEEFRILFLTGELKFKSN
jgi:hypothetical protein